MGNTIQEQHEWLVVATSRRKLHRLRMRTYGDTAKKQVCFPVGGKEGKRERGKEGKREREKEGKREEVPTLYAFYGVLPF